MPSETVTVAFVNQPKVGKTNGSIRVKGPDGKAGPYFAVKPEMLSQFRPGETYQVEFSTREFQGETYRTVVSATATGAAAPSTNGSASTGASTWKSPSPADKESMFVTALMKGIMQAQMVDITNESEMIELGKRLRRVHRAVWQPATPKQAEMNDEIGF